MPSLKVLSPFAEYAADVPARPIPSPRPVAFGDEPFHETS